MKIENYLPNQNIKIYQDSEMFKFNSDTIRLGEFLSLKKKNYTILDVGTNTGALLLYSYLNNKDCKKYYGVDVNLKALEIAKENMELNGIDNYEFINSEFQKLRLNEQVDYIVSNPPYFDGDHVSENMDVRRAKFAEFLPLEDLIINTKRLLKDQGSFFLVYPSFKLANVISLLDKYHFGVVKLRFVYDENKDESKVFLLEARKGLKHNVKVDKGVYNSH